MENEMQNQKELFEFGLDDVIEMPKDAVIEAVVVSMEKVKAIDIFGDKAMNPEQEILKIYYEVLGYGLKGVEIVTYYPKGKISSRSKLGKLIKKYGGLKIGTKIKVVFDSESNYNILY